MAVVTATEVTVLTNISASAGTITSSGIIPIVQDRIGVILNNWFTTDIWVEGIVTFNATARTVVGDFTWTSYGFADGDEVFINGSYRNDGYYDVLTVSGGTMTLATGESVVAELSGASVYVGMVKWPTDVKYAAAQMVKFDYDDRPKRSSGLTSRSLGPLSESYADAGAFGYPNDILNSLSAYRVVSMR